MERVLLCLLNYYERMRTEVGMKEKLNNMLIVSALKEAGGSY